MEFFELFFQNMKFWMWLFIVVFAIIGFFVERINALCSAALGVGTYFAATSFNGWQEESIVLIPFAYAIMVGMWVFFRYLPLIGTGITGAERRTYLIFGTLWEEFDYGKVPILLVFVLILAALFGVGTFFLMSWAISLEFFWIGYVVCTILTLWGIGSFIKSLFN